jgi:hypothetical protein
MVYTKMGVWLNGHADTDRFDRASTLDEFVEQLKKLKPGDSATLFANTNPDKAEYGQVCEFIVQPDTPMFEELYNTLLKEVWPLLPIEASDAINAKLLAVAAKYDLDEKPAEITDAELTSQALASPAV